MKKLSRGDFVLLDNKLAVVIHLENNENVPEDHVALWFGQSENGLPQVWTVPLEYCVAAPEPMYRH